MQKIRIDYADNPELKMALMGKRPGEDCELTVKLSTISADDQSLEGEVNEVTYEYEGEDMTITPTEEEPVGLDMFTDLMEDTEDGEDMIAMEVDIDEPDLEVEPEIPA